MLQLYVRSLLKMEHKYTFVGRSWVCSWVCAYFLQSFARQTNIHWEVLSEIFINYIVVVAARHGCTSLCQPSTFIFPFGLFEVKQSWDRGDVSDADESGVTKKNARLFDSNAADRSPKFGNIPTLESVEPICYWMCMRPCTRVACNFIARIMAQWQLDMKFSIEVIYVQLKPHSRIGTAIFVTGMSQHKQMELIFLPNAVLSGQFIECT